MRGYTDREIGYLNERNKEYDFNTSQVQAYKVVIYLFY